MIVADDEKACLDGRRGDANRLAMELLVEVGRSFGAARLIPITSAHILGHFGSLHQAGIDFLGHLVKGGGRCAVPTTVDPSSVDFDRWEKFRVPADYRDRQKKLADLVEALGVIPSWSCTPYCAFNVPRFGDNIAWAESSAVAFANSVIGARTNRTPFGLDICAAITGKVPEFGLYCDENRRGSILFEVTVTDMSDLDYHTLGAIVGRRSGFHVPVIKGVDPRVSTDRLRTFGAGAASAGSVALFHMMGITPEASMADPFGGLKPVERIVIGRKELKAMEETIATAPQDAAVDMVTPGLSPPIPSGAKGPCRQNAGKTGQREDAFLGVSGGRYLQARQGPWVDPAPRKSRCMVFNGHVCDHIAGQGLGVFPCDDQFSQVRPGCAVRARRSHFLSRY